MFTYQLQPRVLYKESGEVPEFPCQGRFELRLVPANVLGEGSGDLPIIMADHSLETLFDGNTGKSFHTQTPSLSKVVLNEMVMGGSLSVDGGTVSFVREVASLDDTKNWLHTLRMIVPALLAVYLPAPVTVGTAIVWLKTAKYISQVKHSVFPLEHVSENDYTLRARSAFYVADFALGKNQSALLAAASYTHVAERLLTSGSSPSEFAPEILLNLNKVLEVMFGNSNDVLRPQLGSLGYSEAEIGGIFVPIRLLRNGADVGHAKVGTYSRKSLDCLYAFIPMAIAAIKELVGRAIFAAIEDKWAFRELDHSEEVEIPTRLIDSIELGSAARSARIGGSPFLHVKFGTDDREHEDVEGRITGK